MTAKCRFAYMAGLLLGLWGVLGAQSGSRYEPPETSLLHIPVRGARQKPPVWFSHRLHEERRVLCSQCHHEYQGRRNVWKQGQAVKKCGECHGVDFQVSRPDLKNAFHRQCKGCHLKLRQQGRKAGPIECRFCHRRA